MTHHVTQKILFKHCDPAGIVFYPRYFEIINDVVEDWFANALDAPWETFHRDNGCPTVEITVKFTRPSRHGDILDLRLEVEKLGTTSATLTVDGYAGDESRFTGRLTLVCIDTEMRPQPWAESIREKMQEDLKA